LLDNGEKRHILAIAGSLIIVLYIFFSIMGIVHIFNRYGVWESFGVALLAMLCGRMVVNLLIKAVGHFNK